MVANVNMNRTNISGKIHTFEPHRLMLFSLGVVRLLIDSILDVYTDIYILTKGH